MQSIQYDKAVRDLMEVIMFDQWMRFYYVEDKDGKLFLQVPPEVVKAVREEFPHLFGIVEQLNGREIDYQKCFGALCAHVANQLDGSKFADNVVPAVFDSKPFKIEQYVFNVWLKGHEAHLEAEAMPFALWREMYDTWRAMDEVKEYLLKLTAGNMEPGASASTATH